MQKPSQILRNIIHLLINKGEKFNSSLSFRETITVVINYKWSQTEWYFKESSLSPLSIYWFSIFLISIVIIGSSMIGI